MHQWEHALRASLDRNIGCSVCQADSLRDLLLLLLVLLLRLVLLLQVGNPQVATQVPCTPSVSPSCTASALQQQQQGSL